MSASSNTILKCRCGNTVPVASDAGGAAGARARCPKCSGEIAVPPTGKGPAAVGSSCPVCQTMVAHGESWSRCGVCSLVHHQDCWIEVGGCGAYGCSNAPSKPTDAKPAAVNSAWGDTKQCPVCGETIKSLAVKCRYCQTELGTVDPVSADEFRSQHSRRHDNAEFRRCVAILFGFSVVPLFAPITLVLSLIVVFLCRRKMADADPLHRALAVASLSISTLFSLLIVIFLLISL